MKRLRTFNIRIALAAVALRDREEGQALVEYALLLSLIAIVSVGVVTLLGKSVSNIFSQVNHQI